MISFVARSWRNHSNTLPIPFCQNLYTNNKTANRISNQEYQLSKPPYNFIDLITQYNTDYDNLAKKGNSCKHLQYYKLAPAAPQQQAAQTKNTKNSKTKFEDIVVPCTFGEWIILRLMQSEHKPMFLTQQQVQQIIALKENTNFDEQSLKKFYNILISSSAMHLQSLPVLKPVQCLKEALYNAYNDNCGNATQKCKFSLYKKGIARIQPLDSEKQQATNYYKHFNAMQGAGDTNNDKILWRGKNGFIKLEPYQSNKLPEECDNLPNLYDVSTLDTQHIKNIKEMYELYEKGLKKMKADSDKNFNKLPKWALKKYWFGGMDPNIVFDPTSNRYMFRNKFGRNQRRGGRFGQKKRFQLNYNFPTNIGHNTTRLSEITGTNLKSSHEHKNQSKSDDDANNNRKNKGKNINTSIDFPAIKKVQRIKFSNDSNNRDLKKSNHDETELTVEGANTEPEEYSLTHKGSTKNIDEVGTISKMMKMKARHAKYAALQPALLAKLYRNAMANKDSVNPEELEALKIYVEQIMPTSSEMNVLTEPKWEPHKQN